VFPVPKVFPWILENRPEPGGEVERDLGDSFDYATEDGLIRDFEEGLIKIRERNSGSYRFRHAYEHPKKKKGDLRKRGQEEKGSVREFI